MHVFFGLGVNAAFSVHSHSHSHSNTYNCVCVGYSVCVVCAVCAAVSALVRLMLLFSIVFTFVSIFMFQLQLNKIHTNRWNAPTSCTRARSKSQFRNAPGQFGRRERDAMHYPQPEYYYRLKIDHLARSLTRSFLNSCETFCVQLFFLSISFFYVFISWATHCYFSYFIVKLYIQTWHETMNMESLSRGISLYSRCFCFKSHNIRFLRAFFAVGCVCAHSTSTSTSTRCIHEQFSTIAVTGFQCVNYGS